MGKTIISKKVIKLNDLVYFTTQKWRIGGWDSSDPDADKDVVLVGKVVRVQTNGNFNYDVQYVHGRDGIDVATRVRSQLTPMGRNAARLWRLLYD
jgi:hypothetical protein